MLILLIHNGIDDEVICTENVLHAIQVIIDKNNLMGMPMDNAYVKMVIMMIIKIIICANNVQHFDNGIDDEVICTDAMRDTICIIMQ